MHKHLITDDRLVIARLWKREFSKSGIARIVGVHHTTICREIKRNSENEIYRASIAKEKIIQRRYDAKYPSRKIENDPELKSIIHDHLHLHYSPEQIEGRFKCVSHMTIYNYVYHSFPRGKVYLRRKGKKRRIYGTKRAKKALQEAKNVRIDQRPICIEDRERIVDFEGDTVILGGRKQRLFTLVDRKSGYLLMSKLVPDIRGIADLVREKTKNFSKRYIIKSITFDNGTEFSLHKDIKRETGADIFFAYPYHSWERGMNENTNGLIREFFPKDMHGDKVSLSFIKRVQYLLNHRPRKRLNYLTPYEFFVLKKEPVHFKV